VLSADYPGQSNGRVREVPDVRTIRWYTSIGLLDRPTAMRGRTALYSRRHLAQLVAVKRLQADGLTLAEVQRRLIGVPDTALEQIARLGAPPATAATAPTEAAGGSADESGADRDRFWSARSRPAARPAPRQPGATPQYPHTPGPRMHGIRLAPDVSLLLEGSTEAPDEAALAVIAQAAQPLLDALRELGLSSRQTRD
jgi:DNA-binding transcriptional MerR regulator